MIHPFHIFQSPSIFSSGPLWSLAWLLCPKPFKRWAMLAMGYQNRSLVPNTFLVKELNSSMTCYMKNHFYWKLPSINFKWCSIARNLQEYKQLTTIYCVIPDFEGLHNIPFSYLIWETESLLYYNQYLFLTIATVLLQLSSVLLLSLWDGE